MSHSDDRGDAAPDSEASTFAGDAGRSIADVPPSHAAVLELSGRSGPFYIGRAASCDLVLNDLRIAPRHVRITQDSEGLHVDDLSDTGAFVGRTRVTHALLNDGDVLRIGPYRLAVDAGQIRWLDDDAGVGLEVSGVEVVVGGHLLLRDISFSVAPAQRLGVAGPSGAGKSTLLDTLAGMRRPSSGRIEINGIDIYDDSGPVQTLFGYTPQQNIVHRQLTVRRALLYSARLRLPRDVGPAEASHRVDQVLHELELSDASEMEIARMSGGELKRVSIATELIANPGLLVLDEPTAALDPGLTRRFMEVMSALAAAGRTIVLATHDVEALSACDVVVFLTSDGRLVFAGTPGEALTYFAVHDLADVYRRISNEDTPQAWEQRFQDSDIGRAARSKHRSAPAHTTTPKGKIRSPGRPQPSLLSQFILLTMRRGEILLRDRWNLVLLLLQALAIGCLLALVFNADALDPVGGVSGADNRTLIGNIVPAGALATALPLILVASAVWFGAITAARDIVGELPIFGRERQAGLDVLPYVASKILVLGLLAAVQVALLLGIVTLKVDVPRAGVLTYGIIEMYVTLLLAAIAGQALGLLISACVSNADRAQSLVPIMLIPQLVLPGGPLAGRINYFFSSLTITRWAVEALKISAEIPYRGEAGFGVKEFLLRWSILLAMTFACLGAAAIVLSVRKPRLR